MLNNKKLSHSKLVLANKDPRKAAETAHLIYVTANASGITRKKRGNKFVYFLGDKAVKDKKHLERIKTLAIPPSWDNVWICRSPNGHIQATGLDLRNRKQYRYHRDWSTLRNQTKFHHLYEFGKLLPKLRRQIKKDSQSQKLTQRKVLATAIDLMEKTYIRVGNESYEKENGSYGLTTLKDQHVSFQPNKMVFSFNGKKGVQHTIGLTNKKLARIIKQCRDIPGKTLFQYYDEENKKKAIDSTLLNNYIKEATAPEFSAKDIRTWAGSVQAIEYYLSRENSAVEEKETKTAAGLLDWVSQKLGNSRTVCKKYYVHPALITLCEDEKQLPELKPNSGHQRNLSKSEQLLMCILKHK